MKVFRFGLVIIAAAMIIFGVGGTALALHDGGVAHCDACHTMHNSQDNAPVGVGGAHLLIGSDASSTCLICHAGYGQYKDGSAYRAGGDFYWVTKNYSWTAHNSTHYSSGDSHGHNILAADYPELVQDATLTTAPGGSYLSGQLGCDSCHDPHGKQGNEVLLWGDQDTKKSYPGGAYTFVNPAPIFLNAGRGTNVTDSTHSDYGSGMSEWCANCHDGFYDAVGKHVAGNNSGAGLDDVRSNYNAYKATGDLTGVPSEAYWEIVPFETGATTTATLDIGRRSGPITGGNVLCLSCHRAHASPFPDIGRWYFQDTLMLEDSHPMLGDTGATAEDVANKWYSRTIPAGQRSFCNKCHVQD